MIEHIIDGMAAEYKLDRGTAERILLLGLAMQTDDPLQVQAPGQTTSQTPTEQAGPIGSQPTREPTPEELAASKQESPPARKVDPWWYIVGIWNFITDPIWIWNMSKISTAVVVGAGGVGAGQAIKGMRAGEKIDPVAKTFAKGLKIRKFQTKYPRLSKALIKPSKLAKQPGPQKVIPSQAGIQRTGVPIGPEGRAIARTKAAKITENKLRLKTKSPQLTQRVSRLQKLQTFQKLEQLEKAKIRMNLISQGEKAAPGEIKALKNIIKAGTSPEAEKAAQLKKVGGKLGKGAALAEFITVTGVIEAFNNLLRNQQGGPYPKNIFTGKCRSGTTEVGGECWVTGKEPTLPAGGTL